MWCNVEKWMIKESQDGERMCRPWEWCQNTYGLWRIIFSRSICWDHVWQTIAVKKLLTMNLLLIYSISLINWAYIKSFLRMIKSAGSKEKNLTHIYSLYFIFVWNENWWSSPSVLSFPASNPHFGNISNELWCQVENVPAPRTSVTWPESSSYPQAWGWKQKWIN